MNSLEMSVPSPPLRNFLLADCTAKNISHLFLHTAAMPFGTTLQAYLYRILKVPDHQLSHDPPTSN